MKKVAVVLTGSILGLAVATSPAWAHGDDDDGKRRGRHGDPVEFMADRLDLNSQQKDQMKDLFEARRDTMRDAREELRDAREAFRDSVQAGADQATLNEKAGAIGDAATEMALEMARIRGEVADVLTADQLEEFDEMTARMGPGRHRGKHHHGEWDD